jgi:outer membrane protein TolC
MDMITSMNLRDTAETSAKTALYALNVLLADPPGKLYQINDEVKFLPIKVTEEVLYQTYMRESPTMKGLRKDLQRSQLQLELTEKNLLPLPTVTFSGVTLAYKNQYYGSSTDLYTQYSGNPNLDVTASVNLSIPILGPGGLFGRRRVDQSQLTVDQTQLRMRTTSDRDYQRILDYVQSIRQYETTVANNRMGYQSSVSVLEAVARRLMDSKPVSRLEIRDAINQARDNEIALSDAIKQHLFYKTQLAAFIGVDYLPRVE